jgi:hypothetical protein
MTVNCYIIRDGKVMFLVGMTLMLNGSVSACDAGAGPEPQGEVFHIEVGKWFLTEYEANERINNFESFVVKRFWESK